MKNFMCIFLSAWLGLAGVGCQGLLPPVPTPTPVPGDSQLYSVFEGITPCSVQAPALPQIRQASECELMIWHIVLYQAPKTGEPTTYSLNGEYGMTQPGSPGVGKGRTTLVMEGKWSIERGTQADPEATVFRLSTDDPQIRAAFLKISDNILHVLDGEGRLMVGNGGWSYTLNRTDNRVFTPVQEHSDPSERATRPAIPGTPEGASVFATFEGRTPCHEIIFELARLQPYVECAKMKWRLVLYQDAVTRLPGTYLYMNTSTIRQGNWAIMQGSASDPQAVVYQLELDGEAQPVSFLRVDENNLFLLDRELELLVGNKLFSYTLSKVD